MQFSLFLALLVLFNEVYHVCLLKNQYSGGDAESSLFKEPVPSTE